MSHRISVSVVLSLVPTFSAADPGLGGMAVVGYAFMFLNGLAGILVAGYGEWKLEAR